MRGSGLILRPEMVAVKNESGDAGKFEALVKKVKAETDAALILMSNSAEALTAGVKACADRVPLIYAATDGNSEALAKLAKEHKCPLAIKADSLEDLSKLSDKLTAAGLKDLVLDPGRERSAGPLRTRSSSAGPPSIKKIVLSGSRPSPSPAR